MDGAEDADTLSTRTGHAGLLMDLNRFPEALAEWREVVAARTRTIGVGKLGRLEEAAAAYTALLAEDTAAFGLKDPASRANSGNTACARPRSGV